MIICKNLIEAYSLHYFILNLFFYFILNDLNLIMFLNDSNLLMLLINFLIIWYIIYLVKKTFYCEMVNFLDILPSNFFVFLYLIHTNHFLKYNIFTIFFWNLIIYLIIFYYKIVYLLNLPISIFFLFLEILKY